MSAESDLVAALSAEKQKATAASTMMSQAATLHSPVIYAEAEGAWSDAIQQAVAARGLLSDNPGLTDTNALLLHDLYPQNPNLQAPLPPNTRIYHYSQLRADAQVGSGKTPTGPTVPPIYFPPGGFLPGQGGPPLPEPSSGVPNWLLYLAGGGLLYFLGARYLPRRLRLG